MRPWLLSWCLASIACGSIPPRLEGHVRYEPASEFWILADTQLHNFAGDRSEKEYSDAVENVAIRPPSLDLWSETLLSLTLERMDEVPLPMFFLGDGANMSCEGEYIRFLEGMGKHPWFGVIGNHDGFYMGNLGAQKSAAEWASACKRAPKLPDPVAQRLASWGELLPRPTGAMTKAVAVLLYLENLYQRKAILSDPLLVETWSKRTYAGQVFLELSGEGSYTIGAESRRVSTFAAIAVSSDAQSRGYLAFVVQSVELPSGDRVILVDTSDFSQPPPSGYVRPWIRGQLTGVKNLPGQLGMVGDRQRAQMDEFVAKIPAGRRFYVMGHHDWQSISVPGARNVRRAAFTKPGFVTYVSGHTHQPTATGGFNGDSQWEINVASITDWPMQFARLRYWPADRATDIELEVFSSGLDADCTLRRGLYGEEDDRARELDYAGTKYLDRALFLYRQVLVLLLAANTKDPSTVLAECDPVCLRSKMDQIDRTTGDPARKDLLRALAERDRDVLRRSPLVLQQERACATWASEIEQAYWAGTWVGKLIRFFKRPASEKDPITFGRALEGKTLFRVRQEDLPTYPE